MAPRCAPGGGGGIDPTPALPDPSAQVTAQPARPTTPSSAEELCRPDITRSLPIPGQTPKQLGMPRGRRVANCWAKPGRRAYPAGQMWSRPRGTSLPPLRAEHPSLHPPETIRPHRGHPHVWPPGVPGHGPALPLPHLETIAVCVRDTDTENSGFRGGSAGSGDSAGDPPRRSRLQQSPAREERQEAEGPKAKSPSRGCPLPHPQSARPSGGPGPSEPHPAGLTLQGNATPQDSFSGPACPLSAPCSPEARTPQPRSCPLSGKKPRLGAQSTQRDLCGAAQRLPPGTHTPGRGAGPRSPGARSGSGGEGARLGHPSCGRGPRAEPT